MAVPSQPRAKSNMCSTARVHSARSSELRLCTCSARAVRLIRCGDVREAGLRGHCRLKSLVRERHSFEIKSSDYEKRRLHE